MQALELAEVRGRLHDEEMAGQAQEARVSEAQSLTAQLQQQVRELQSQMVTMDRYGCWWSIGQAQRCSLVFHPVLADAWTLQEGPILPKEGRAMRCGLVAWHSDERTSL